MHGLGSHLGVGCPIQNPWLVPKVPMLVWWVFTAMLGTKALPRIGVFFPAIWLKSSKRGKNAGAHF